jgi:hypothetical protein
MCSKLPLPAQHQAAQHRHDGAVSAMGVGEAARQAPHAAARSQYAVPAMRQAPHAAARSQYAVSAMRIAIINAVSSRQKRQAGTCTGDTRGN